MSGGWKCPKCGAPLEEKDLLPEEGSVRCEYCGALSVVERPVEPTPERAALPLPDRFRVETGSDGVVLIDAWKTPMHFAFAAGGLVCFAAPFVAAAAAGAAGGGFLLAAELFMACPALLMVYYGVAGLLNETRVRAERRLLRVSIGPVPWPGSKTIPVDEVRQLYSRVTMTVTDAGGTRRICGVFVRARGGKDVRLVGGLDPKQALFVEQQVERALGIKDERVRGELPRSDP